MIELYDAARLQPRRDLSLPAAVGAMLLGLAGLGGYALLLQSRLHGLQAEAADYEQRLKLAQRPPPPSATLLADLQRETERLEAEAGWDALGAGSAGSAAQGIASASQWMDRVGRLAAADISLQKIDIDRAGVARIEGLAASPQAVSSLLQAWDRQQPPAWPVAARAIEVRQDAQTAPHLRFRLRATASGAPQPAGGTAVAATALPKAQP